MHSFDLMFVIQQDLLKILLVFRRKDLCEAKPGYSVGNFDQITMLK